VRQIGICIRRILHTKSASIDFSWLRHIPTCDVGSREVVTGKNQEIFGNSCEVVYFEPAFILQSLYSEQFWSQDARLGLVIARALTSDVCSRVSMALRVAIAGGRLKDFPYSL